MNTSARLALQNAACAGGFRTPQGLVTSGLLDGMVFKVSWPLGPTIGQGLFWGGSAWITDQTSGVVIRLRHLSHLAAYFHLPRRNVGSNIRVSDLAASLTDFSNIIEVGWRGS